MPSDSTRPDISLVIATCSRAEQMRSAVGSLLAQQELEGVSLELVIVDDQSTDHTPAVLREIAATSAVPVRILQGTKSGVAAARNLAASHARGTWLASFDDDELAEPDWLARLYRTALAHSADCVGGTTVLRLPAGVDVARYGLRARRLLGETAPGGTTRPFPANMLPATNNVLLRRALFDELGGYDPRFTEGGEDTDFFLRARLAGRALWLEPAAVAHHIIPERRTSTDAILLTSKRIGVAESRMHRLRQGSGSVVGAAAKRLAVAALRDLPSWALAALTQNAPAALEARASLAYTEGLLRSFSRNSSFVSSMDFRMRHGERSDPTER